MVTSRSARIAAVTILAKIHHTVAAFLDTAHIVAAITINRIACACDCFTSHV